MERAAFNTHYETSRQPRIFPATRRGEQLAAQYVENIPDFDQDHDSRIRAAAFEWLASQDLTHERVFPRPLLTEGFEFERWRIRFLGPQGIFKPAAMQVPLSIATIPNGPYNDEIDADNFLEYRYRGTNPNHRDNVGLRFAMRNQLPLVYFYRAVPGEYAAAWPVYVLKDSPDTLTFSVAIDDVVNVGQPSHSPDNAGKIAEARREYITTVERHRLHQRVFRQRVLRAYSHQCTFCHLRHSELLDAAHIIPDNEPGGEPVVSNGLSLCRLHHSAFDRYFLGVRPDHVIEVRPDVLEETDGPTLQHAIKSLHGSSMILPSRPAERPSLKGLELRYDRFQEKVANL